MKNLLIALILVLSGVGIGKAQDYVDDTKAVLEYLHKKQAGLRNDLKNGNGNAFETLSGMMEVGLWDDVKRYIQGNNKLSNVEKTYLEAEYWWYKNDFNQAEQVIKALSNQEQQHELIVALKANLLIEAWLLPEAEEMTKNALVKHPAHEKLQQVLSRSLLLQKKYPEALALAKSIQAKNPNSAFAYLLEADVYFWDQEPQLAEAPLVKGLSLNPLDANARFSYGYAIWRRFDARLLNDMAAQWEVALAINPLHFQTHWHWGNGHTNLTFADYADPKETEIRAKLEAADEFVRQNKVADALEVTVKVGQEYTNSVLPAMHQGSILYSDFDHPDRHDRLNEAEEIFLNILDKKTHYGPAHNALAAVIKSKRIPYLSTYDSVTNQLLTNKIDDWDNFATIFPDVTYYPGEIAKGMAWNQLYTSIVYFPFLTKQRNAFVIPPLHIDLAIAMNRPSFRFNTTFDNRQWMDIRGVGSGAADIGYVERGAYGERNVLLHEYVHLFHGRVLTDKQNRQIRKNYYNAMAKGLTLDYYSQNNESEYLAQTYPAYFEYVKVHPLDFKSMNTHNDLITKDPDMYKFLDEMITKEKAYLAGDKSAMASNWAQVYLNLSNQNLRADLSLAGRYLDTALQYDSNYLPVLGAYANFSLTTDQVDRAKQFVSKMESIDASYAPIYVVKAAILDKESGTATLDEQAALLEKAFNLEDDLQFKAQNSIQLRQLYHANSRISDAVKVADIYGKDGADVSTYLRDRKDDALAYAATMRSLMGTATELEDLGVMVAKRPQNYSLRGLYADALLANGKYTETIETMNEVQRILGAADNRRSDFDLRILEANQLASASAQTINEQLNRFIEGGVDVQRLIPLDNQRLVRILVKANKVDVAKDLFDKIPDERDFYYISSKLLSQAYLEKQAGQNSAAIASAQKALETNPYLLGAYELLQELYKQDQSKLNTLNKELESVRTSLKKI